MKPERTKEEILSEALNYCLDVLDFARREIRECVNERKDHWEVEPTMFQIDEAKRTAKKAMEEYRQSSPVESNLIERAFIAGRSQQSWESFKKEMLEEPKEK